MNKTFKRVVTSVVAFAMAFSVAPVASLAAIDPSCPTLNAGDEVKVVGRSAIYIVDYDGKIRPFTSGDIYKTYKAAYGNYKLIGGACLNSLPQPSQFPSIVTYRPGAVVVRYSADPTGQLYVVQPGNALAKISLENARVLHGANFRVRDISLIDWPHYVNRRADVTGPKVYPGMTIRTPSTGSKVWYVSTMNKLHEVSPSALAANFILPEYIFTVPDSAVAGMAMGDAITGINPMLMDRTQSGFAADGTWVGVGANPTTPTGPVSGSQLSVSLASNNPTNSTNIPVGTSALARTLDLSFSAGNADVTVTGLNLMRTGLSVDQDINNVYLMDGNTIIASNLGISNGVVNFSNPSAAGLFKVPANGSKKITVGVTMNSSAAGRTIGFSLQNASAVMSNASAVSGSFPMMSATYTGTSLTNSGGVQITNSSAGPSSPGISVNAGQKNFTVGQFSLLGQNQTVQVRSLKFTLIGSANASDVTNFSLWNGGTQIGQTVGVANGNEVVFDLSTLPLQLNAGQNVVLTVRADIMGGVNRYFQMSVQRNYDVVAHDMQFNMGVLPTLNTGSFPMNLSYVNINAGSLTVTRSTSSPSTYLLPGGTNQTVATFDMTANGEAVRLTAANIGLTLGGTLNLSHLSNLKLVDDQGQQIGTTQSTISNTSTAASYSNLNYIIPANTTRKVSVVVDVSSSAAGTFQATLSGMTGQGFTSLANLTISQQAGNLLTANSTILTVAANGTPANLVTGQPNAKIGSFTLTAGAASDVSVSNITLKVLSTNSPATVFQNLKMMIGNTQIGTTQSTLTNGTSYNFSLSQPVTITKGGQLVVDVYADVLTNNTSFSATAPVAIASGGISAIATATNQSVTSVPGSDVNSLTATVTSAGSLSYSPINMPVGAHVAMGLTNVKLGTYQLSASTNEDIKVTDLTLRVTSTNSNSVLAPQSFVNYRLVANGITYGQATNINASASASPFELVWSGLNNAGNFLIVPKGGTVNVDVIADVNTWDNLQSVSGLHTDLYNAATAVRVATVTYQGAASSVVGNATSTAGGNTFNVFRSTLSAAAASSIPGGYSTNVLSSEVKTSGYTFTAAAQGDATLRRISFSYFFTGVVSTSPTATYTIYMTNPSSPGSVGDLVATGTISLASSFSGTVTNLGLALPGSASGSGVKIAGGASGARTLIIAFTGTAFESKPNVTGKSAGTQLVNWGWDDLTRGVTTPVDADPQLVISPINGNTVSSN